MRKWRVWDYAILSPFAQLKAVERRKAMKVGQTVEQRTVTLHFDWREPTTYRQRTLSFTIGREETAIGNLEQLAKLVEHLRVAEMRGIHGMAMKAYRLMYPLPTEQQQMSPPPQQEHVRSSGPYATLHVADNAPLEVAEAAYRALVKSAHPDTNGAHSAHTWMVTLNLAIEQIRAAKARQREGQR
jgi:hypothetical protein